MNKKTILLLVIITFFSLFFNLYKRNTSLPCLNADEVANAYDAYSILKTGRDQYGNFVPLRFKSFGDYKLPVFTYLSVPFIKFFGLNREGIRLTNILGALFFPLITFLFVKELFKNKKIALLSAFLVVASSGVQILGRQAHEGYLNGLFILLATYFFLKVLEKQKIKDILFYLLFLLVSLFTYHSSRLFGLFFLLSTMFLFFIKKIKRKKTIFIGTLLIIILFTFSDLVYKPTRIKNLLFFNNIGFSLKINELRSEGGKRFFYNKLLIGIKDLSSEYSKYFSPQFLAINGDTNVRFGYPGMGPITLVEYFFIFIGFYYLFKNKEKWRFYLLFLFFLSPISASLSWAKGSLTRSFFVLFPVLILSAYGFYFFIKNIKERWLRNLSFMLIVSGYLFFQFFSWNFFFNHYSKRAPIARAWQCGYKELFNYLDKIDYRKYKKIYLTRKNGQPYIYYLFYSQYPPSFYQKKAHLSSPDEYGFGQVEKIDNFVFNFHNPEENKNALYIGYPDDFNNQFKEGMKKIKVGSEEIFWIQAPPKTKE